MIYKVTFNFFIDEDTPDIEGTKEFISDALNGSAYGVDAGTIEIEVMEDDESEN